MCRQDQRTRQGLRKHYKTDNSNEKNVVYVQYKNEAGETALLSRYKGQSEGLPEPQGEARKEFYIDGSSTSREITLDELEQLFGTLASGKLTKNGTSYYAGGTVVATTEGTGEDEKITISDYTYLLLIATLGDNELAKRTKTEEFTGTADTVDTYQVKTDYDLGDTVRVKNNYGIEAEAQIVETLESEDNDDGYNLEPVFEFMN